jgi:hypothetical protein
LVYRALYLAGSTDLSGAEPSNDGGLRPRDDAFAACHLKATTGVVKNPTLGACICCQYVIEDIHRESLCRGLILRARKRSLQWRFGKIRIVGSKVRA